MLFFTFIKVDGTEEILPVLVVGGGPTGLALGALLSKRGVRNRVIEAMPDRTHLTKALAVQAGTLEAIAEEFGADSSARMVKAGLPVTAAELHFGEGATPVEIDFSKVPSVYNYILMLPQWSTETFLEELLRRHGGKLERGACLRNFEVAEEFVHCELASPTGSQAIKARYVVACDGAHSEVRKKAGISFEGSTYRGEFWLGDVDVKWPISTQDRLHIFLGAEGVVAFFPLGRAAGRFRVVQAETGSAAHGLGSKISLEAFQHGARLRSGIDLEFSNPEWLTTFNLNDRIAPFFRKGRIFLAGDACHIHSPAGGQGMNTGIQDAFSLAHKLALKIQRGEDSLDSYNEERRPNAVKVVRVTGLAFRLGLIGRYSFARKLRALLAPLLLRRKFVQRRIVTAIAQISVARADILRRRRD